jgi:hypothetical protein
MLEQFCVSSRTKTNIVSEQIKTEGQNKLLLKPEQDTYSQNNLLF